jgi:hypothetical protein
VSHTAEDFPVELWQNFASPVWMDINPSDTLTFREAREHNDERHICALQLQVIERGVKLWSNPGDLIFSARSPASAARATRRSRWGGASWARS